MTSRSDDTSDAVPGTSSSSPDEAIVARFLERLLLDRQEGDARELSDYVAMFPDYEEVIAREWARLASGSAGHPAADGDSDPMGQIGAYEVLEEIGRGGQGVVYRARDTRLPRVVALKVLRAGTFGIDPRARARFRREAETLSKLDHPNIATVIDVGTDDGVAYLAMRFVEGRTLRERLVERRQASDPSGATWRSSASRRELDQALILLERCARAIHHAHGAGVIHRDLKPGNVMIDPTGQPVLLDFGLARSEDDGQTLTGSHDVLGTPAYMAPEQLRGEAIGPATDVWALGVLLHEVTTGRRPFEAPTRELGMHAILAADPPSLRRAVGARGGDLDVIAQTALAKDPLRRYASAEAFAEDLRRVRVGEPILARPATVGERCRKWIRRNPLVASFLSLVILVALGAAWAAKSFADAADREMRLREQERLGRYFAEMALAGDTLDRPASAPRILELIAPWSPSRAPDFAARGFEWHLLHHASHRETWIAARPHEVTGVAWHPDGERVAAVGSGEVALMDAADGRVLKTFPVGEFHDYIIRVSFNHDGSRLAASDHLGLSVFDVATGERLHRFMGGISNILGAAWHPREPDVLVVGSYRDSTRVYDVRTGKELARLPPFFPVFSPDGAYLTGSSGDGGHVFDTKTWTTPSGWGYPKGPRNAAIAAFSPDGRLIARPSPHGLDMVDPREGRVTRSIPFPREIYVGDVEWGPRNILAVAMWDGTVTLWDPDEMRRLEELAGHVGRVNDVAFDESGARLLTGGLDGTVRLFGVARAGAVFRAPIIEAGGKIPRLATIGLVGDPFELTAKGAIRRHRRSGSLAVSPDEELRLGKTRGVLWLRGPDRTSEVRGDFRPEQAAWSADGRVYFTEVRRQPYRGVLQTWSLDEDAPRLLRESPEREYRGLAVSFDGRSLFWTTSRDVVRATVDAAPVRTRQRHDRYEWAGLALSPDARVLAVPGSDGVVQLLDAETLVPLRPLKGHTAAVRTAAFAPDGRRVATGGADGTVRVWEPNTGRLVLTLLARDDVRDVTWSRDGRRLMALDRKGNLAVWDAGPTWSPVR